MTLGHHVGRRKDGGGQAPHMADEFEPTWLPRAGSYSPLSQQSMEAAGSGVSLWRGMAPSQMGQTGRGCGGGVVWAGRGGGQGKGLCHRDRLAG